MNRTLDISNYGFTVNYQLGKVSNKKNKKWLNLSIRAGWLGSAGGQNPTKKNIVFNNKNKKMIRMV